MSPGTMGMIGQGLNLVGGLVKGSSAYSAGAYNRDAAYASALDSERQGAAEEARIRDAARQTIGEQVAAQGANGFQQGTGSAIDALTQSQVNAAMDALNVRRQAASRARALRAQGDLAMAQGRNDLIGSLIGTAAGGLRMATDWAAAKAPYQAGGGYSGISGGGTAGRVGVGGGIGGGL